MGGSNPVLESMRAREPGLQALSNPTGSKIKNTHIFPPYLILSQRYEIQYWEEPRNVSCLNSEWKAIKPTNLKVVGKYAGSEQP